jgi:hypothetical protein
MHPEDTEADARADAPQADSDKMNELNGASASAHM